jgi:hypothetical protein
VAFIREALVNPETNAPFILYREQVRFIREAFTPRADGSLPYVELIFSTPKKGGKTLLAALLLLYVIICLGGQFAEGYACANDAEQAQSRVYQAAARILQASPLLRGIARIGANRIEFSTGATITALASHYASAAGANPTITVFDELWAYTSEAARRMWDEMAPVPTRVASIRLTVTYAGFVGESDLLEGLYRRAMEGEQIAPDLYRADDLIAFWTHRAVAPWQTEAWLAQMHRQLRENQFRRMICNEWATAEEVFLSLAEWDSITDPASAPIFEGRNLTVFTGCDASVKHDSTSLACVAWERGGGPLTPYGSQPPDRLRLVIMITWQPSPDQPPDFEATVERTLLDWRFRGLLRRAAASGRRAGHRDRGSARLGNR